MKKLITICVLILGLTQTASADIWKWVDALGETHFVSTMRPIYTWVDESGKVHYADHPGHEDAISADLIWHSASSIEDAGKTASASAPEEDGYAYPGETAEQRAERKRAEEYYCKRATEIYDSYTNAPQLYKTNDDGEREYLSKADAAKTIAETRAKKDELCN
jgi:hypothetical protein